MFVVPQELIQQEKKNINAKIYFVWRRKVWDLLATHPLLTSSSLRHSTSIRILLLLLFLKAALAGWTPRECVNRRPP